MTLAILVVDRDAALEQRRQTRRVERVGELQVDQGLGLVEDEASVTIGARDERGAGVGVGTIFGSYLAAALRNPSAAQGQFGNLIFGFAVTEALGIFSLLIALLLLFAL